MPSPSTQELPLAAEFPPAGREQWRRLVADVLKGASFDDALVSKTYDGLRIGPLYECSRTAQPVAGRPPGRAWQVLQRLDHPEPAAANAQALQDLENGATGLLLIFAGAVGSHGYGLDAAPAALERTLEGIHFDAGVAIELELGSHAEDAAEAIAALVRKRGISAPTLDLRFGFDPLGLMAVTGRAALPWPELAPRFAARLAALAALGFKGPFAVADARPVHAAGGSEAQELGFALANALAYLRALEAFGVPLDDARRMIFFRLAADADQLLTLAKFRAIRKLWARVEAACGLAPKPAFVGAETAWRMMTRHDPPVNMLRAAIAAFAAGLGGADAVAVQPFTLARGLPDGLARRLARNLQLILLDEANLARVADPAAGSGAIEDLTDQLCRAAWCRFQAIEAAAGTFAALEAGSIQRDIARVRAERESAVAHRLDPITGTSEFATLDEAPVSVLEPPAVAGAPLLASITFEALPQIRLAEPFEVLRDASDRALAATGSRPAIFLAVLGEPSDFTARASFARNLFAAGGIEAVDRPPSEHDVPSPLVGEGQGGGLPRALGQGPTPLPNPPPQGGREPNAVPSLQFTDLAALVAAFKASGAKLACLCGSDAAYAGEATAAAQALAAAGAAQIYLAGRATAIAQPDKAGGAQFIHPGCNALATLNAAHDILRGETAGNTP